MDCVCCSLRQHPLDRLLGRFIDRTLQLDRLHPLTLERDAEKIREIRAGEAKLSRSGYEAFLKTGWSAETLDCGSCEVRVHRPPGCGGRCLPLLYWIHGGGLTIGGARDATGAGAAKELARRGVEVVWASVEYRLAPEHPFPAGFDDCVAGLLHLLRSPGLAERLGFEPQNVHLAGVSAGGNLVAALASALALQHPEEAAAVRSVFVDEPMLNPMMDTKAFEENADSKVDPVLWLDWCWRSYLPDGREKALADWRVCPQLHVPPGGLPPLLVLTTTADPLRDDGRAYVQAMKEAGVEVTHVEAKGSHVFGLLFDKAAKERVYGHWTKMMQRV